MTSESIVFSISELVDCIDERGIWITAEVQDLTSDKVKVHYLGYSHKFDRWVPIDPSCIVKQWRQGEKFQKLNRIDVLDTYQKWQEAQIIETNASQIKVHYKGFTPTWDEWINNHSDRIKELGTFSRAYGVGKKMQFGKQPLQDFIKPQDNPDEKEAHFERLLSSRDLLIFKVEGDGNCLFRTVSHQLYGSTDFHDIIRAKAIEYIQIERYYFEQFVAGDFQEYIDHQSRNGAWGDDVEIQAMSEIYGRPFEIFAYSSTPMKTFHESSGVGQPLRLAYHGQSHYNSIVHKDKHEPLAGAVTPGTFEDTAIDRARNRDLSSEVLAARENFDRSAQFDIEEAMQRSLQEFSQHDPEDQMINQAIQESQQDLIRNGGNQQNTEDEMIRAAIEESKMGDVERAIALSLQDTNSSVEFVINMGFTHDQAVLALQAVGDNPERMIDFILNS